MWLAPLLLSPTWTAEVDNDAGDSGLVFHGKLVLPKGSTGLSTASVRFYVAGNVTGVLESASLREVKPVRIDGHFQFSLPMFAQPRACGLVTGPGLSPRVFEMGAEWTPSRPRIIAMSAGAEVHLSMPSESNSATQEFLATIATEMWTLADFRPDQYYSTLGLYYWNAHLSHEDSAILTTLVTGRRLEMQLSLPGAGVRARQSIAALRPHEVRDTQVCVEESQVVGQLVTADNKPVVRGAVWCVASRGSTSQVNAMHERAALEATTNESGHFYFSTLLPGRYLIGASSVVGKNVGAPQLPTQIVIAQHVEVSCGAAQNSHPVQLKYQLTRQITGKIVGLSASSLSSSRVRLRSLDRTHETLATLSADGSFDSVILADCPYTAYFMCPGFVVHNLNIPIGRDYHVAIATPCRPIRGFIHNVGDDGARGAVAVNFRSRDGTAFGSLTTSAAANWYFEWDADPSQTYDVTLQSSAGRCGVVFGVVPDSSDSNVLEVELADCGTLLMYPSDSQSLRTLLIRRGAAVMNEVPLLSGQVVQYQCAPGEYQLEIVCGDAPLGLPIFAGALAPGQCTEVDLGW